MKSVVVAFDAQSGGCCWGLRVGAIHKGMWALTPFSWRPKLRGEMPWLGQAWNYGLGWEPARDATDISQT